MLFVVSAISLAFMAVSCEQGVETISYVTDTVRTTDTFRIKDTLIRFDTLRDTARIPIGTVSPYQLFGVLIDGLRGDTGTVPDSTCGYLSLSSRPAMRTALVHYGSHPLAYTGNQNMITFFEGYNTSTRLFPTLASAQYEGYFREPSKTVTCSVRLPYYPTDTSTGLSFDSVAGSVTFPAILDSLSFFDAQGRPYDSVDILTVENPKSIRLDSDLMVRWESIGADWYGVQCIRYILFSQNAYATFDTFTLDTQIVIPHSFFYQDSLTDKEKQYDALIVTVVPVSGPAPATWDSSLSFGGKGYLFALHYDNVYGALNVLGDPEAIRGMSKRTATAMTLNLPHPAGMLTRLFGTCKP